VTAHRKVIGFVAALLTILPVLALGHAFPDHAEPKVGTTLIAPPARVRIWFDAALEPAFSTLAVRDGSGRNVDNRDAKVDGADAKLLEVTLPPLGPGSYRVFWSVVARDGHRTSGDYSFVLK
jgi:copper resistance protein C